MVIMKVFKQIGSPANFSLCKVGHMGANGYKCIAKASLGKIDAYRVSQKTYFQPKSRIWSLCTFISKEALLKTLPYTRQGIWVIMIVQVRLTHTGFPKKHIFSPKVYKKLGSPENFSLYKVKLVLMVLNAQCR